MAEVKFCGMTREEDVLEAARLGASYIGVILTSSPRQVTPSRAAQLFEVLDGTSVRRVGVFGDEPADDIARAATLASLDVIQLHGRGDVAGTFEALRGLSGAECWRVVRVGPTGLTDADRAAFTGSDGILLDTMSSASLGGTGEAFDWSRVAADVAARRAGRRLILAGGLHAGNVRDAIDQLSPDVVDVSSGVEISPGVKDHARMGAFLRAVRPPTLVPDR